MSDHEDTPVTLEIRRGNPTPEELAAVVAVVSDAYAAEVAGLEAGEDPRPSAWMQTRRSLRRPLDRGVGWGRFSR
ncbi:acyl-CoA carboxylase epsilon subunit [Microbacterium gorillae]|uniref:acyl-CoA carboxylase epsilon subunit n=1 Tax=Microbacterium gorillae TaxID=1231063 RepID=UPI003D998CE4